MSSGRQQSQAAPFTPGVSLMPEDFAYRLHTLKENHRSLLEGVGGVSGRAQPVGAPLASRYSAGRWGDAVAGRVGPLSAWTESHPPPSAPQIDGILARPTGAFRAGCRCATRSAAGSRKLLHHLVRQFEKEAICNCQ